MRRCSTATRTFETRAVPTANPTRGSADLIITAARTGYTPRNWLVHNGALYVIDFEWSGMDLWIADLARLHLGIWANRPDLRKAFLAGYGRDLSDADHRALHACAVLTAVWLVVKAHETRQPSFEDASRTALLRLIDRAP